MGIVRAALLFVGFYGILLAERRCPASAAVMLPPRHHVPCAVRRKSNFCHPPDGLNHLYMKDLKEESIMDILNIVFSALNLLATVIIGVINVTWMISRDVFRDKPRAKNYSKK